MATITATCGHQIDFAWSEKGAVYVKDYTRSGKRAVSYLVLCPVCLEEHEKERLVLKTVKQREHWLGVKNLETMAVISDYD